jgi:hypothetical protein
MVSKDVSIRVASTASSARNDTATSSHDACRSYTRADGAADPTN